MLPDLPWFVYAMLLAPLGLILARRRLQSLQVRAAREWPSAAGKVVVSKAEVRKVKVIDSDRAGGASLRGAQLRRHRLRIFGRGRKLRNNRVSIGEDLGNFEVAETIAKYPVGAVVTVYYNPLHPDQAVLERDLPKGLWGCLGIGTAIVLAIVFGSAIGLHAHHRVCDAREIPIRETPRRPSPSARSVPSWRCSRWCCTGRRRWR